MCRCISSAVNLWLDKDISLEFLLVIKRGHLNWLVFVCGYKLFQTFWFELWIMDYFIAALHNPQIELKQQQQKKRSRGFILSLYKHLTNDYIQFSWPPLPSLDWNLCLCILRFRDPTGLEWIWFPKKIISWHFDWLAVKILPLQSYIQLLLPSILECRSPAVAEGEWDKAALSSGQGLHSSVWWSNYSLKSSLGYYQDAACWGWFAKVISIWLTMWWWTRGNIWKEGRVGKWVLRKPYSRGKGPRKRCLPRMPS